MIILFPESGVVLDTMAMAMYTSSLGNEHVPSVVTPTITSPPFETFKEMMGKLVAIKIQ